MENAPRVPALLLLVLLCLLALFSCAPMPAPLPQREESAAIREVRERLRGKARPAVLFVGNSYSFGAPGALKRLASRNGISARIDTETHGGWSLEQHAAHEPTLRSIREGSWDVVVLQEHSLRPAASVDERARAMVPAMRVLAAEARAAGAVPVIFQTWARRDAGAAGPDFPTRHRRVREGCRAAARAAGDLGVVPVGDAWAAEMAAGRGNRLYQEDGSHPSREGDRLTARVFFDTLFAR